MNYLNLHTDILRSIEYLGSEPIERATWLNLIGWCCSQENGGIIVGAADWTDRKWQQLCGVTKEEATLVSELYRIDNQGCLRVKFYPSDKEAEVKAKRATARANGAKGGRPKKTNQQPNPETQIEPTSVIFEKAEGKGREGNGKEEKIIRERERTREEEKSPDFTFDLPAPSSHRRPTLSQAKSAAETIGITPAKAEEWWNCREASEWIKGMAGGGTSPVGSNWQADLTTYAKRGGYGSLNGKSDHRQEKREKEFKETIKLKQL